MKIAILVKNIGLQMSAIGEYYIRPLASLGIKPEDISIIPVTYDSYKKVSSKTIKENFPDLLKELEDINLVFCTSTEYFKTLAKRVKVENLEGIICDTPHNFKIIKGIHHTAFKYADKAKDLNMLSIQESAKFLLDSQDTFKIKYARYITDVSLYQKVFDMLLTKPMLAADIEGWGLKLDECGVATIAFSWSSTEGVCLTIDYTIDGEIGEPNIEKRELLRKFLTDYTGTFVWHGASFDIKQLIVNLWMHNDLSDSEGLNIGLLLADKSICTKEITYLATNSAEGNTLGLKHLAAPYTGEYAINAEDITKFKYADIMRYNLIDTMATFWVYETYYPKMIERGQKELYFSQYKPNMKLVIFMEITGVPLDMEVVIKTYYDLLEGINQAQESILALPVVEDYKEYRLKLDYDKYFVGKKKPMDFDKFKSKYPIIFNPSSGNQVAWVLHEHYCLPIIEHTKSGKPATDGDTLAVYASTSSGDVKVFLEAVLELQKRNKILDFVKAFMKYSIKHSDGIYWLHGNQNQTGTISGRLSSSQPNLANLDNRAS